MNLRVQSSKSISHVTALNRTVKPITKQEVSSIREAELKLRLRLYCTVVILVFLFLNVDFKSTSSSAASPAASSGAALGVGVGVEPRSALGARALESPPPVPVLAVRSSTRVEPGVDIDCSPSSCSEAQTKRVSGAGVHSTGEERAGRSRSR